MLLVAVASPAAGQVLTKPQQQCLGGASGAVTRLAGATFRSIAGCLATAAKGKLAGTVAACAAGDPSGAIGKATGKNDQTFARACTGTDKGGAPKRAPFGVSDGPTTTAAVASAEATLVADTLGSDLDAALIALAADKPAAKCQQAAVKATGGCHAAWLKAYAGCAAAGVKRKTAPIASAAELAACVGADPKNAIAKACGKLATTLAAKCTRTGVALPTALPGCGASDGAATAACLARSVACRSCRAVATSAGLAPACDVVDDGAANGSCAPVATPTATATPSATPTPTVTPSPAATPLVIGNHACTLDPFLSTLVMSTHQFFVIRELAGAIDLQCGTVDPATGTAPCTCTLDAMEPVEVTGIGWACLRPAAGCPAGSIACNPGASLDHMTTAHHTLGPCTGNDACATACATTCAGSGTEVLTSGCEGYCTGGSDDGAACAGDLACAGGVCTGPDHGIHGQICQCQCLGRATDSLVSPSGMTCNLGVDVAVESTLPCGDGDIVLEIGPRCVPFTTARTDTVIQNADNVALREVRPDSAFYGVPRACDAIATDGPAALTIASTAAFLDAPIAGDMAFIFILTCGAPTGAAERILP